MTTKENIIYILEQNKGSAVSGQALATQLGISRAAVWKAIKELQKSNYDITANTNVGYTLNANSDILSTQAISSNLHNKNASVVVHKSINSTNTLAKQLAAQGASHASLVVAEQQTQGKGRLGRQFKSPGGTGLYMSVILRGNLNSQSNMYVTSAAAVAVVRSLKSQCDIDNVRIKWVNDLYINTKKCGGILCEAVTDMQTGNSGYIIVGIGLNLHTPCGGFEKDIQNIATSILQPGQKISRSRLAAAITNELVLLYNNLPCTDFMSEYKSLNIVPGKKITVYQNANEYVAHALSITNEGYLRVRLDDNTERDLSFGEVSIKM